MSDHIKKEIYERVNKLKSGNSKNSLIAREMEESISKINCFFCLDAKVLWGPRSPEHIFWSKFAGNNDLYWIGKCNHCDQQQWLRDSNTNNIITSSGYKMFSIKDSSSDERFSEIKRLVEKDLTIEEHNEEVVTVINYPKQVEKVENIEVPIIKDNIADKPDFPRVFSRTLNYKKDNSSFKVGIKEIVQMLGAVLQAHLGIPNLPLLQEIQAVVSYETISKKTEEIFCDATEDEKFFVFVIINDSSESKKGNFLNIINGEKCNVNLKCKYWIFKTGNQLAVEQCKNMMRSAAENELISLSNSLNQYYEK